MQVEINLLPRKEPKKFGFYVIIGILIILLLLATLYFYLQIHSAQNEMASVNNQIAMTKKIEAQLQKNQTAAQSSSSVTQLNKAISWTAANRIETIPVMRYLTALLPDRGFIQSFGYQESGTVTLTVQFDTEDEAAAYLDSLNSASWISSVSLTSLNAATTNSSTSSGSQTNTANSSSSTTGSSNSTTAGSNTANTTGSTAGTGTNPAGSSGNATTSGTNTMNSTNNTATASGSSSTPRYIGQFQIQFNKAVIAKQLETSNTTGEGVSGQ